MATTDPSFLKQLEQPLIGIGEQYLALKLFCGGKTVIMDNDKTVQWEGNTSACAFFKGVFDDYKIYPRPSSNLRS